METGRKPKIGQFDVSILVDQDIVRLDVPNCERLMINIRYR